VRKPNKRNEREKVEVEHEEEEEVLLIDLDLEGVDEEAEPVSDYGYFELHPTRDDINERLDKFVASRLDHLSRAYVQKLVDQMQVTVDGVVRNRTFKMTPGEVIGVTVPEPESEEILPEDIPLDVIYEDADLLVLNKPAGMVVHPAPGHPRGTLVNALVHHAPEIAVGGTNRPGIVHRLDKDTSGVMVVAKSDRGRTSLIRQWNAREVQKHYLALVRGVVPEDEATIDVPIGRDPVQRNRMAAVNGGRDAVSRFTVCERFVDATLLDVVIETGRTHQIRVHFAYIGHPVVGDSVYNSGEGAYGGTDSLAPRQFLHAAKLGFKMPNGTARVFEAPLPPDLAEPLDVIRTEERLPE
jgi:23S rRNA pseudouridine1911/1915/1917 synthase